MENITKRILCLAYIRVKYILLFLISKKFHRRKQSVIDIQMSVNLRVIVLNLRKLYKFS